MTVDEMIKALTFDRPPLLGAHIVFDINFISLQWVSEGGYKGLFHEPNDEAITYACSVKGKTQIELLPLKTTSVEELMEIMK